MRVATLRCRLCLALCLYLSILSALSAQDKAYPVQHLPMLEKFPCYVLFLPGTEDALPDLISALEKDARQFGKRKSVVLVSQSASDTMILDIKRRVEGGLQQVNLQRDLPTSEVITRMIQNEGVRFVLVNTRYSEKLPSELIDHVKAVSKERVNLAGLPPESAGYQVCWQWKRKGKKNQMWVIIYAPGPWTMFNIMSKCLVAVAHAGGDNIREPGDIIPVSLWNCRVDAELIQNGAFNQWLQAYVRKQSIKEGRWIEPTLIPISAEARDQNPSDQQLAQSNKENINDVSFILHKNIPSILSQTESLYAPFKDELRTLQATHLAILKKDQLSHYLYIAPTPGLLRRLITASSPFDNPSAMRLEVPDLSWIRRISIVFTKHAKEVMPEGARNRLLQELKAGLTFWQIYDETILENILKLEEIGLQGLPGGAAAATRKAPIDAMLVIDVSRYQMREPTWKEVGNVQRQSIDLPFSSSEPSPHATLFKKAPPPEQWLQDHAAWWEAKEEFKKSLQQTEFEARVDMACFEEVSGEISCSLVDMRPTSSQYGAPVHPELVLSAVTHQAVHVRSTVTRRGRFKYLLVEGTPETIEETIKNTLIQAGYGGAEREALTKKLIMGLADLLIDPGKPGVFYGRRYSKLVVELVPLPIRWEQLPQYAPDPNSPAVTEVSAKLANSIRTWLEERALFDPSMKAPPALPPDYVGKVEQVDNNQIAIRVDGLITPEVGDWIEVRCKDGSLPKARITVAAGNTLTALLHQPTSSIQVGDEVFQTAPPPEPPKPASPPAPSAVEVRNEVVITISLPKRPTTAQIESLKQRALKEAAAKQSQAILNKYKVKVDQQELLKIAAITSHQWNARTKQYVIRVRFSGTVRAAGGE